MVIYNSVDFGTKKRNSRYKTLHITIPEDLDYTEIFQDLFFNIYHGMGAYNCEDDEYGKSV